MNLIKTAYFNSNGEPLKNQTQRMEFFFHYWQYVFTDYRLKYDSNIFKSHRTIINKLRLQVKGNYKYCNKYIIDFYTNEELFKPTSFFKKHINLFKIKTNFTLLESHFAHIYSSSNNFHKNSHSAYLDSSLLLDEIDAIEGWLNKYYTKFIVNKLLKEIKKKKALNNDGIEKIKQLVNCLIIELLNKGYDTKYLISLPESLFDERRFPFAKIFTDFTTKEKYDEYKKKEFSKLGIKTQLKGIANLVNRKPRIFYVIFRVYNVEFNTTPIIILDAEFYNPLTHPKIALRNNAHLLEEYFSFNNQPDESKSKCNLIIKIKGYREESLIFQAYKKAIDSLNIFNKELQQNGRITLKSAVISNDTYNRIYGSTSALKKDYNILNEIDKYVNDYFDFINRLNSTNKYDKKVITFISQISNTLRSNTAPVRLEEFWYAFESTFGTNHETLKKLFKNCYKIYNEESLLVEAKIFLNTQLENEMGFYSDQLNYILKEEEVLKFGLDIIPEKTIKTAKFKKNLDNIKQALNCKFVDMFIDQHVLYITNKSAHGLIVDKWIDYNIAELYVERNLISHQKMNDDFFYHKRFEIVSMTYTLLRIFLPRYLKHRTRLSISEIMNEIEIEANLII